MREVRGCPVVDVHLRPEGLDGGFEEEGRVGGAGVCPDDVWGLAVVPGRNFGDDTDAFVGVGEVGAEEVEALGGWVGGGGLWESLSGEDGWKASAA